MHPSTPALVSTVPSVARPREKRYPTPLLPDKAASHGEPQHIGEVHDAEWKAAVDAEIKSLEQRGTWKVVSPENVPPTVRPLSWKWVFKQKPDKKKARLTARGDLQDETTFDPENLSAPVVRISSVRLLCAYAASRRLRLDTRDVTAAYLYPDLEAVCTRARPRVSRSTGESCSSY